MKQASDLAKQRIGEAAASAESTVKSIEGRDRPVARDRAAATTRMLEDVAAHLEVMLKDDLPQQIEATQRLIEELAELERELAMMLGEGGANPPEPMTPGKPGGMNRDKKPDPKDRDAKTGSGKSEEERQAGTDEPCRAACLQSSNHRRHPEGTVEVPQPSGR